MTEEHTKWLNAHYRDLDREERRAEEYNRRMGIEPDEPTEDEDEE